MKFLQFLLIIAGISFFEASSSSALDISESTFAHYQEYLKTIGYTRKGAFAVSPEGHGSYYIYCDDVSCLSPGISQEALSGCASLTGKTCLVMAYGREERIAYTVVPRRTDLSEGDEILANVLSADRLKTLIVGNTLQGEYMNHSKWMEYYAPDGAIRGRTDRLGFITGRYEFKDNALCYYYDRDSDWNWCSQFSVVGDKLYLLEDGKLVTNEFNTKLLPGNPHNL